MSEPHDYRAPSPPPAGRPQGWSGTARLPLGAPPPDLPPSQEYGGYPPPARPGRRPAAGDGATEGGRSKTLDYTLKGIGLLGVAVASGFLWYLIRNDPTPLTNQTAPTTQQSAGQYKFTAYTPTDQVTNCAAHATAKVHTYLVQHPCQSMTRILYTTTINGTQQVVTSVITVTMTDPSTAAELNTLSQANNTGHVKDQVEEGSVVPNGPTDLENGGYASQASGNKVIIVNSEFVDGSLDTPSNLSTQNTALRAVSEDALRLG